jgi:CheY-like chemotaxis protein
MKPKTAKSKYKAVMLIDDSETDNYVHEIIIKKSGFAENVYKHSGGVSSLEFLKNIEMLRPIIFRSLLPSYLFLDINMPVLDGFQFLDEFINFSKSLKKGVKIVILSSSANSIDIEKASHYNEVVKFLHKPLTAEDLKSLN